MFNISSCRKPLPLRIHLKKSAVDGIGMGLGFTLALTALGIVREILGNGTLFEWAYLVHQN